LPYWLNGNAREGFGGPEKTFCTRK
jgi:hypothetical protein